MDTVCPFLVTNCVVDFDNPEPGVRLVLKLIRPDWAPNQVELTKAHGGFANSSLVAYIESDVDTKKDAIMFRVHREEGLCALQSRDREFVGMQLAHSCGVFPTIIATYSGGVAYAYAQGRTLTIDDLVDTHVNRLIARGLAELHNVAPGAVACWDQSGAKVEAALSPSPMFSELLLDMLPTLPDLLVDIGANARYQAHRMSAESMAAEINFMEDVMSQMQLATCFQHADFHYFNILYDERSNSVSFIDYEVANTGYACADMCSLFGQRCMQEYFGRYSGSEPPMTDEIRHQFIKSYLQRKSELANSNMKQTDECYTDKNLCYTDQQFQLMDYEQRILYPYFFLYWIVLGHRFAGGNLELDLFRVVPKFKRDYFKLKEELSQLLSKYLKMKASTE